MTMGVHQARCYQPSGQIQHLSMPAASLFDLSVTADVGDSIVGYFKGFRPGLGRVSGKNSCREKRNVHLTYLNYIRYQVSSIQHLVSSILIFPMTRPPWFGYYLRQGQTTENKFCAYNSIADLPCQPINTVNTDLFIHQIKRS